jgi:hypothetical protein
VNTVRKTPQIQRSRVLVSGAGTCASRRPWIAAPSNVGKPCATSGPDTIASTVLLPLTSGRVQSTRPSGGSASKRAGADRRVRSGRSIVCVKENRNADT